MDAADRIDIEKYVYTLPDSFIAKYPLADRDQSKLLLYDRVPKYNPWFPEYLELRLREKIPGYP